MEYILTFIMGAVIGSFLNVCIYRMPLGKSIVNPPSHCPFCGRRIRWYCNVPLLSFIFLRGKCLECKRPIPVRYFLVELATALLGVALLYHFSLTPAFMVYCLFSCALIVVVGIDVEHQEIPDIISLPGILIGLVLMTAFRLDGSSTYMGSLVNSVLGILAGGLSMFLMGAAGEFLFKKEALGGGDVKLMAMIGAFLGWKMVLLTFFLAPVTGAGVGIFMKLRFGKEIIPYGPYLALGALVSLFFGDNILRYLFNY